MKKKIYLIKTHFVHNFSSRVSNKHTFKGSIIRHIVFEKVIHYAHDLLDNVFGNVAFFLNGLFYIPIIFAYGMNCNFPMKDICLYAYHWLKNSPIDWIISINQ